MKKIIYLFACFFIWFFFIGIAMASQPFPDTGQTICCDANNQEVSCDSIQPGDPYYGQDAHYQPRLPRSYTKLGYGGAVLADNALHVDDGGPWIMTRDNVTGLIWEIKTNANRNDKYNWSNAQEIFIAEMNSVGFGGFSDWRLPEIKELISLTNRGFYNPAIDTAWFPKTALSDYWLSTPYWSSTPGLTYCAWFVYFKGGNVVDNHKSHSYYVRAVRSGQSDTGQFGSLLVHIEPQGAVDAGAQWRRKDTSTWYDSGYTETNVPVGTYTIEFKAVPDWRRERTITVIVEANKTVTGKVSYFEQVTGLPGVMMLLLDE